MSPLGLVGAAGIGIANQERNASSTSVRRPSLAGPVLTCYSGYVLNVGVLQVQHPDGQVFAFEPGSLALAFVITGAPTEPPWFETLEDPSDLGRWARDVLNAPSMAASPADLAAAKSLRSAIFRATDAVIDGRRPANVDRRLLNDAARLPPMTPRLTRDSTSGWASPVTARALLSAIARDAIELVGGPKAARLKRCEGVNCAIPFVDTSRPGTRRWCSMERCGNRAKARTHYRQHRKELSS